MLCGVRCTLCTLKYITFEIYNLFPDIFLRRSLPVMVVVRSMKIRLFERQQFPHDKVLIENE